MKFYNIQILFKVSLLLVLFGTYNFEKIKAKIKSESRLILEKLVNYEKIFDEIKNIYNYSNSDQIENNLSKFDKELEAGKFDEFNPFLKSVKALNNPISILETTIEYFSSNKIIETTLLENKKNFEAYFENKSLIEEQKNNISSFLQINPSDADKPFPAPYFSKDIPCTNSGHCAGMKLLWMKCSVLRISIRTAYEALNTPLLIMAKVIFMTCACVIIPMGEKRQVQCNNTKAQPGLVCNIPNQLYTKIFKVTVQIWSAYQTLSHTCWTPISPYF